MRPADKYRLLHGPYTPQPLRKGDRATCLLRDGTVVITSWSDGRISWPRCRKLGHRGGSGLLVDDELVRAIRSESSLALQYWFGVQGETVWRWRQAFGVEGHAGTEGSRRLIQANADAATCAACRAARPWRSCWHSQRAGRRALRYTTWRRIDTEPPPHNKGRTNGLRFTRGGTALQTAWPLTARHFSWPGRPVAAAGTARRKKRRVVSPDWKGASHQPARRCARKEQSAGLAGSHHHS
jgi:hypothetical protein